MSESMKNGLLWAAAALGVLSLIQGLLRGVSGLFFGGFGGREMGMNRGGGYEGKHGMAGGMPHGGGFESFESLAFIVVVAIIAIVIWAFVGKKKQSEQLVEVVEVQSAKEEDNDLTEKSEDIVQVNDSNNEVK